MRTQVGWGAVLYVRWSSGHTLCVGKMLGTRNLQRVNFSDLISDNDKQYGENIGSPASCNG